MGEQATDQKNAETRVGVYICHCGGNISDHVDVAALADNIKDIEGVAVARTHMFMCSDPGQESIQEDLRSGRVNRVVVASCAPSLHELTFRGAIQRAATNPFLYEHANIREQVSWVHHGEKATAKATRLVVAAVAKARRLEPLEPIRVDARRHVVVIGGGVAGMRAALDLAGRGIEVALVEKEPFLGGRTARLDRLVPTDAPAREVVAQLAEEVLNDPRIAVHACSRIVGHEGYVGNFKLTVASRRASDDAATNARGDWIAYRGVYAGGADAEREWPLETGAIVLATGFSTYRPREGEYGYLQHPEVITLPDFIRQLAESPGGRALTLGGRPIRRMALIHCVGSRQIPGIHEPGPDGRLNEYCSRTCCSSLLQAAVAVRRRFPATRVLEYYRDIRTYGRGQEEYYEQASNEEVLFFRYEPEAPPQVERIERGRHPLQVRVRDTLTFGETLTAEVDLVVLGVGMEAHPIADLVEMMKLPTGMDGFLQEVHPKLRPVEVATTGVLLAGTCQAPMDVTETCNAAQAAAAKASSLLARGCVELDPYIARVDGERCTGSGGCVAACPVEGALRRAAGRAEVNAALCTGCGICVGACPEQAIDVSGWRLDQYEAMVDAIVAA